MTLWLSQVLSRLVEVIKVNDIERMQLSDELTKLHDILGGCERILRTPIPVAYTRHTSRCVLLWLTFFPYIVWNKMGWFVVPVSVLMSMCLLGINEIGVDIEEPFSLMPLGALADEAHEDGMESVKMQAFIRGRLHASDEEPINGAVFVSLSSPRVSAVNTLNLGLIPSLPMDLHGHYSNQDDTMRLLGPLPS